jgi:hypothetical protein
VIDRALRAALLQLYPDSPVPLAGAWAASEPTEP